MNRVVRLLGLLAIGAAVGCVSGIEPPDPTPLVPVAGGQFLFGTTTPCFNANESVVTCQTNAYGMPQVFPTVLVDLAPFAIEAHEVTNFQYRHCVEVGSCAEPEATNTIGIEDYYGNPAYDDFPVVNVTHEMAATYCAFHGRRLPTEIEWERVAAGPKTREADKRRWAVPSFDIDVGQCDTKLYDINLKICNGLTSPVQVAASTLDVVDEGGRQVHDLTGNVSEWVDGFYRLDLTCKDTLPAPCDCFACNTGDNQCKQDCYTQCDACENDPDCFGQCAAQFPPKGLPRCIAFAGVLDADDLVLDRGTERMVRGGNFQIDNRTTCRARTTDRFYHQDQTRTSPAWGFRCAADLS
jgi:formylglycine-generating enzyme required for sulfatase activity